MYDTIDFAVEWWIEKIKNEASYNDGINTIDAKITKILARIKRANSRKQLTYQQIKAFREVLFNSVEDELRIYGKSNLFTSHEPIGTLCHAANESKIDYSLFPWTTAMIVFKDKINVCEGAGNDYETIYNAPKLIKRK